MLYYEKLLKEESAIVHVMEKLGMIYRSDP